MDAHKKENEGAIPVRDEYTNANDDQSPADGVQAEIIRRAGEPESVTREPENVPEIMLQLQEGQLAAEQLRFRPDQMFKLAMPAIVMELAEARRKEIVWQMPRTDNILLEFVAEKLWKNAVN